jgi:hypothetical protein
MVVPNRSELVLLIENTTTPDFQTYNIELDKLEKRWGGSDQEIEAMRVTGRFQEFKFKNRIQIKNEKLGTLDEIHAPCP